MIRKDSRKKINSTCVQSRIHLFAWGTGPIRLRFAAPRQERGMTDFFQQFCF